MEGEEVEGEVDEERNMKRMRTGKKRIEKRKKEKGKKKRKGEGEGEEADEGGEREVMTLVHSVMTTGHSSFLVFDR